MKKHLIFLIIILLSCKAFSQNIEELMTRKYLTCQDIVYNSLYLIPEYYEKNRLDTVNEIINYWESRCGISEPLLRIKILLAIHDGTFTEDLYNENRIVTFLRRYRQRIQNENYRDFDMLYYTGHDPFKAFDNFTVNLATKLKVETDRSEIENFFLDYYLHNFENIFFRLQDTILTDSKLKHAYDLEVNRFIYIPEGHFSVYTGSWMPIGNVNILGNHPIFGMQGGIKSKNILVDGVFEFRFGDSPNAYYVYENDSLYNTTDFFGFHVGVELGYKLIYYKQNEINLLTGIGYEGFDALSIGDINDPDRIRRSINSGNINFGIGYRKYFRNRSYIGLETRYNIVNYQNPNGTNLSGNTLTIRLKYGIARNLYRDRNLLGYDHKEIISNKKYAEWLRTGRPLRFFY